MADPLIIAGANGQVGRKLAEFAAAFEFTPIALGRDELDISDRESVADAKARHNPSAVINAAAYTAVDNAEKEQALADLANRVGPANLASVFADSVPLIHFSTDYVFDGTHNQPYTEEDDTTPLGVYGTTKRAGELSVIDKPFGTVLRTAWVYSEHGNNFLKTMIRVGRQLGSLEVVDDQIGTPTYAGDIAKAALTVAKQQVESGPQTAGLYHLVSGGQTSWHGFAAEIFRHLNAQTGKHVDLAPISTSEYPTAAKRPVYSVLSNAKIARTFRLKFNQWQEPVAKVVAAVLASEEFNA